MSLKDSEENYYPSKNESIEQIQKRLNESESIQNQQRQMDMYESGEKLKRERAECDSTTTDVARSSESYNSNIRSPVQVSDHGKSIAADSTDGSTSILHTPPPYDYGLNSVATSTLPDSTTDKGHNTNNVASCETGRSSYHDMPLKKLRYESRRQLGLRLDLELPNIPNWKSVADLFGFSYLEIQNFESIRLKTELVLREAEIRYPQLTVGNLCEILQSLERNDVVTDLESYFERDVRVGNSQTPRSPISPEPSMLPANTISVPVPSVVTVQHDSFSPSTATLPSLRSELPSKSFELPSKSLPPEVPERNYDAFVLYDVADRDFIMKEFLPKIEKEAGISLFIPDRDLNVGVNSYDANLEAMLNRCLKLVVILSDDFLQTPYSQWALNVAVAIDPAAKMQKVIPVIYKRITAPNILSGINACDRTRVLEDSWFWNGLIRSLTGARR